MWYVYVYIYIYMYIKYTDISYLTSFEGRHYLSDQMLRTNLEE